MAKADGDTVTRGRARLRLRAAADSHPYRDDARMPYLACPTCDLTVYSAAKVSTVDECPRYGAILDRRGSIFRTALPSRPLSQAGPPPKGHRPRAPGPGRRPPRPE